jgi:predicted extracellular nuclease
MHSGAMISRLLAAVVAGPLVLFATPSCAETCKPDQCIRIGTYNIKLFAKNGPADTSAEIEQLADRIAGADQANLDVVVLEEINKDGENWKGPTGLRARLQSRGYAVAIEGAFGGEDLNRPQFVILLHRTNSVSLVAGSAGNIDIPTTFDPNGPCEYKSLRPPVTSRFKTTGGSFSFQVIGVHLKSQNKVGNSDSCDDDIRRFQAQRILAHIAKLKADNAETNIITVGDFNAAFDAPEYEPFRTAGYHSMVKGACSANALDQCSYIVPQFASIIDHVVVHSSLKQAVDNSGAIAKVGDLTHYLNTQSDHVPVWASFRID